MTTVRRPEILTGRGGLFCTLIGLRLNFLTTDEQKCKGCSVCVANCPTGSIRLSDKVNSKGYHYAEMTGDGCIGCSQCAVVCPDSVITVYKVKI